MIRKLKERLDLAFGLTHNLVAHLDEAALALDLPGLPSNRIAGQLWCIVGARESYMRAIEAGAWAGFSCSLDAPGVKQSVLAALDSSRLQLAEIDSGDLEALQIDMLFALLEHEVMHHGQLVRYVYANGLTFPESWNKRYTV